MDSKITVRPIERTDCAAVYELVTEMVGVWRDKKPNGNSEMFEDLIFEQRGADCIVAFYDGVPAGYCFYNYNASSINCRRSIVLDNLFVSEKFRRKGIGTALFDYMRQKCTDEELLGFKVFTPAKHEGDTAFYAKMGCTNISDVRYSFGVSGK